MATCYSHSHVLTALYNVLRHCTTFTCGVLVWVEERRAGRNLYTSSCCSTNPLPSSLPLSLLPPPLPPPSPSPSSLPLSLLPPPLPPPSFLPPSSLLSLLPPPSSPSFLLPPLPLPPLGNRASRLHITCQRHAQCVPGHPARSLCGHRCGGRYCLM